jgi:hypothetical protein
VAVGAGASRLSLYLRPQSGRGAQVKGATPAEVNAGSSTVEVSIPAEALQGAIAEVGKAVGSGR